MAWTRRYDEAEPQRVNRWLAQNGVCSRREAEDLIARGLVSIDGAKVEDVGRKISSGQTLTLADAAQAELQGALSVVLHKPIGVVSAHPEPGQAQGADLLTREALVGTSPIIPDAQTSLPPLGRLDMDSRGLLLLSNDGVLAKAIIGPESDIEKEYLVQVGGPLNEKTMGQLRFGLRLDGRQLRRARVDQVGAQHMRIILKEGRNRQIRRMCQLVGLHVIDLLRVRIGPLRLGDLPDGRWRTLTADERAALLQAGAPTRA